MNTSEMTAVEEEQSFATFADSSIPPPAAAAEASVAMVATTGLRIQAAPLEGVLEPPVLPAQRIRAEGLSAQYVGVLERRIAEGTARAAGVIEDVFTNIPVDQIAPAKKVGWAVHEKHGLLVKVGDVQLAPSEYAWAQIATKAGVPATYLDTLRTKDPQEGWRAELAAHILREHYGQERGRMLVRSVRGQLRGWLSDRYRRLDSRPLLDALAMVAKDVGAIPYDGTATSTRHALKVVVPEIVEPMPGEYMVLGVEWSNSDYGNGTHSVRSFAVRVVCLNGMTRENALRQIHLGGRLGETVELSDRTHRLDTAASVSALRDIVRGALGPGRVETLREQLEAAAAQQMSSAELTRRVRNQPKPVIKAIVDAYESEDVINLPPGKHAWRASNAVSWIARNTGDAERRLDLERLAGGLVGSVEAAS